MFFNKGASGKKLDYFLSFFQYYIYTKNPLPMDIEFLVQDIFALTRPQWKLASNLEEASKVFQLAVAQDQKTSGIDKGAEQDDGTSGVSSDDDNADDLNLGDHEDDEDSDSEDAEVEVWPTTPTCMLMTRTNHLKRNRKPSRISRTMMATLKKRPSLSRGKKKRLIQRTRRNSSVSMRR